MRLKSKYLTQLEQSIQLPFSKSISNRLLIMQALAKNQFKIENLSEADDTKILIDALNSKSSTIDVGMAGTAFRFLTAYYAIAGRQITLTGHDRMKKRPIQELVNALRKLGACIDYLGKEDFPPLKIHGNEITGNTVHLNAGISSQFISALMLIAPYLKNGLKINLIGEIVSRPYISMTLKLMQQSGISYSWKENDFIQINQGVYSIEQQITVEPDWSAAAFFYQFFACSHLEQLRMDGLHANSIQGDAAVISYFAQLGVKTSYTEKGITLSKVEFVSSNKVFDLTKEPDLIPSFAIAASYLLGEVEINGVQTLRVKECNRVEALQIELAKVGINLDEIDESRIKLKKIDSFPKQVSFDVYNDHRMAMAFAACASFIEAVEVADSEVVSKSFPHFWNEMNKLCELD